MSEEKDTEYGCSKKCSSCRKKFRDDDEKRNMIHRLNRIEGQIRGINGMVMSDTYCVDIITQVMAVQAALNAFNRVLLSEHLKTCVASDLREGNRSSVDELTRTLQKLMK